MTNADRSQILPPDSGNQSNRTTAVRGSQLARGRKTVAAQDVGNRPAPTSSRPASANLVSYTLPLPNRTKDNVRTTSATADIAAKKQIHMETERPTANDDEVVMDRRRENWSKWKRDLKREAPPALYGYRPSLTVHAVMSQAERRRRLVALQSGQTAPPLVYSSHVKP